jgi:hypothetical protein
MCRTLVAIDRSGAGVIVRVTFDHDIDDEPPAKRKRKTQLGRAGDETLSRMTSSSTSRSLTE